LRILKDSIAKSIAIAMERTRTEPFNIEKMIEDIVSEFPRLNDEDFTLAIRSGSLGKYGATYKFSTQTVCVWIREYLKQKNRNTLVI
jgi:hypothetical protein